MSHVATALLRQLVQEHENRSLTLPVLPDIAQHVRDTVAREPSTPAGISSLIAGDAALCEQLIQIANTPLFGTRGGIDTLEMAVDDLGIEATSDLVTMLVMKQLFQAETEYLDKRLRQLWEHSATVAAISHALAGQFTSLSPVRAMLAGLIHDIGAVPILARAVTYPELREDESQLELVVGALHARIGLAILEAWNFPAELCQVSAEHENLERDSEQTDYVDVVTVANLQSYLGSHHSLAQQDWSTIPAFTKLGLNPELNVIEMKSTADDIKEMQRLLSSW